MLVFLSVVLYIISVVVCHGVMFGHVQNKFHNIAEEMYYDDLGTSILFALVLGLFGPFGIGITILTFEFGRFGFKFK